MTSNSQGEDGGGLDRLLGYMVERLPEIRTGEEDERELFRRMFDDLPVAVRLQDQDLITRECNRAFCRMIGRPRTDLVGHSASLYTPKGSSKQLELARRTMRAELERHCRATVTVDLIHADGHTVDVIMMARPLRLGEETLVLGVYFPREELTNAVESPKILSSSGTESGSTAS